jgi:hypothetical protein
VSEKAATAEKTIQEKIGVKINACEKSLIITETRPKKDNNK